MSALHSNAALAHENAEYNSEFITRLVQSSVSEHIEDSERIDLPYKPLSPFWAEKFAKENNKRWDRFYKLHGLQGFKDRNYLGIELGAAINEVLKKGGLLLDAGCGVGNTLIPLAKEFPEARMIGIDCAPTAIDLLNQQVEILGLANRIRCSVIDLTVPDTKITTNNLLVDVVTLIFCLSALSMEQVLIALANVANVMHSGSHLYIRDYAIYDASEARFSTNSQLKQHLYVRNDGTRSQYFELDELCKALRRAGFDIYDAIYSKKIVPNRKLNTSMRRIFVQIRAMKI